MLQKTFGSLAVISLLGSFYAYYLSATSLRYLYLPMWMCISAVIFGMAYLYLRKKNEGQQVGTAALNVIGPTLVTGLIVFVGGWLFLYWMLSGLS
jgi:hypothetical protein